MIKTTVSERIKELRIRANITQDELAKKLGYNSRSSINKIEKNAQNLPQSKINAIAKILNVSPSYIMGWEDETGNPISDTYMDNLANKDLQKPLTPDDNRTLAVRIPVLGDVAAGIPISAIEDILDWEEITEQLASTGEFFGLRIQGDSMAPRICDGDVVIVRQQSDAESGDIVIVRIDHEKATCKRLRKYADGAIELISLNPSYEPMFFPKEEIGNSEDDYVVIIGVVVELRGKL